MLIGGGVGVCENPLKLACLLSGTVVLNVCADVMITRDHYGQIRKGLVIPVTLELHNK